MPDPNKTIYLVSCVSKKCTTTSRARDLYISDWFTKARDYVEATHSPWFILSAEYGLVPPDEVLAPYERTLNTMSTSERKAWATKVKAQMDAFLPAADRIVVFAGQRYREFLMDYLRERAGTVEVPMEGLTIGKQLHYLQHTEIMSTCEALHEWVNSLPALRFPFNDSAIPMNGIYVLFERGEVAHGTNRIVRVGTHSGINQLRSRLRQHFLVENKDRSIFRKNIGRALLNRDHDPFLPTWELDRTSRLARAKHVIDFERQNRSEERRVGKEWR